MNVPRFIPFIALVFWQSIQYGSSLVLPTFSWDPRNKYFSDKICGGEYAHIIVEQSSKMNFVCPSQLIVSSVRQQYTSPTNMYENMYIVTKDEFDRCEVDKLTTNTKYLLTCNKPRYKDLLKYKSITFSPWAIGANAVSFHVNKTYYFIATSNGTISGLENRKGGRCHTHNMRLAITICEIGRDCFKNEHLCYTPVQKVATTTTTTLPTVTTSTTTTTTTRTSGDNGALVTPKAAPKQGSDDSKKSGGSPFGVVAVACLIGGLFVGLIIGFVAVILTQRYAKRYRRSKNSHTSSVDSALDPFDSALPNEDNKGYRHSTEIKRFLSTSSSGSSERYSTVPSMPTQMSPPPGTIAV